MSTVGIFLLATVVAANEPTDSSSIVYAGKDWSTTNMGGVEATPAQLKAMQMGDYVLHAKNGQLIEVPVTKIPLPMDPCGHVQRLALFVGADNTIYAAQCSILSKSTDGGFTWSHLRSPTQKGQVPDLHFMNMRVRADGTWIRARNNGPGAILMETSIDEGHTWKQISQIGHGTDSPELHMSSLEVLRNGDVIVIIGTLEWKKVGRIPGVNGWKKSEAFFYRSRDGGRTFSDPFPTSIGQWIGEINVAELPSGRLLSVNRHQRPQLPHDPPNIIDITGARKIWETMALSDWGPAYPYKHVFVADSTDGGGSWSSMRQVTTEFGQCHAAGVGLQNGRVVVIHDHRYPRSMASARAVVSDDEGQTWCDEVYYLAHGSAAGYARTISLDGQEMLTMAGSYYGEIGSWHDHTGNTQFNIIRWRLND